jgi:hypothetical protein
MSTEEIEKDARDAGFRLAAKQFVKLTHEPLVAAIARHLGPNDPSMRGKVAAFLETELGEALVTGLLAIGLSAMPKIMGETQDRMSKELRVKAMTDGGDIVADLLMGPLREAIGGLIRGTPAGVAELPAESVSHPRVDLSLVTSAAPPVATDANLPIEAGKNR